MRGKRSAFTLVEILVVISIIAVLMAVMVVSFGSSFLQSEEAATRTLIVQLDDIIKQRQKAIAEIDLKSDVDQFVNAMNWTNTSTNRLRAEFLIRKNLYRQALPQTQYDLLGYDLAFDGSTAYNGTPAWKATALTEQVDDSPHYPDWCLLFDPNQTPPQDPTIVEARNLNTGLESVGRMGGTNAQVLLFAVTQINSVRSLANGKRHPVPTMPVDQILTRFIQNQSPAADRNPALPPPPSYLVDSWGQPMQFYNWPTGLLVSGSPIVSTLVPGGGVETDPADPANTLANSFSSNQTMPNLGNHSVLSFNTDNYHHVDQNSHPLLVSSGADTDLGLEPADTPAHDAGRLAVPATADDAYDNITNQQAN